MATPLQLQALLRFLSKDSKLPLALAMAKAKELQGANLSTPETIIKTDLQTLQSVLGDEKIGKQVMNAARRVTKKRTNDNDDTSSSTKRSKRGDSPTEALSPAQIESYLALPLSSDVDEISSTTLITNRAPLVLAFAVIVLKYTMPEQPLSSRLSLAQAVVSANSRTKAASLGIETGKGAENEGWGQGQPTVKVLGREISVLKRWGYSWHEESSPSEVTVKDSKREDDKDTGTNKMDDLPALWGLDLEDMKRSDARNSSTRQINSTLPIHRPESARDYLLKSFTIQKPTDSSTENAKKKRSKSSSKSISEKETSLGLLLGAIDLLCQSWASVLSKDEIDRRAWSWYVAVRPEVQGGISGWGQKAPVHLSQILDLRRKV
ncbi:hypothetical protein AJ79_00916 [Helicocarpus griseus UAMH5409]|uniref:Impact N-terminal domain-containing protein n=1 Tax=Helicocarpus griseus UAMH5409 TaxID=1447875 RepID=A0A2B7Y950_9EURO|nr:hypothetical protein AJ79_00916 [Helicocarpus griseus UAMH5409]